MWEMCSFISAAFQIFGILLMVLGLIGSMMPEARKIKIIGALYRLFYFFDIEEEVNEEL